MLNNCGLTRPFLLRLVFEDYVIILLLLMSIAGQKFTKFINNFTKFEN